MGRLRSLATYDTGHSDIDGIHREISECINDLIVSIETGSSKSAISLRIDELCDLCAIHTFIECTAFIYIGHGFDNTIIDDFAFNLYEFTRHGYDKSGLISALEEISTLLTVDMLTDRLDISRQCVAGDRDYESPWIVAPRPGCAPDREGEPSCP